MPHALVFASANSRLHADLTLSRIRRAGMALDAVTAIHPKLLVPNSVPCWLTGSTEVELSSGAEHAVVAGALSYKIFCGEKKSVRTLREGLELCGLTGEQSSNLEGTLLEGRTLLCIEAENAAALSIIFHIFLHVGAERIVAVEPGAGMPAQDSFHIAAAA